MPSMTLESFKFYLNEHVIVGDFKESSTDMYNIMTHGKDKLIIYPAKGYSPNEIEFQIPDSYMKKIAEIALKHKDESYPYPNFKEELSTIIPSIVDNLVPINSLNKEVEKLCLDHIKKRAKEEGSLLSIDSGVKFGNAAKETTVDGIVNALRGKYNIVKAYIFSHSKLKTNTKTKSIWIDSNPISHATRIGKFDGKDGTTKQTYIIPFGDTNLESPRMVYKILQSLVKKFPDMANYSYIDYISKTQTRTNVKDILNGAGEIGRMNVSLSNVVNRQGTVIAYHGTSEAAWKDISRKGLIPGRGYHYVDKIQGHSEHNIYLTTNISDARKYAVRASGASKAVVLEVKIRDTGKINFDEDNLNMNNVPEKVNKELKIRLYNLWIKHNKDDKYWFFQHNEDHVAEHGLDITDIAIHAFQHKNALLLKDPELNQIFSVIGYYALNGRAYTFSYKGHIMPRDIRLKEEIKSQRYVDSDKKEKGDWNPKNFKKKYSSIIRGIKVY